MNTATIITKTDSKTKSEAQKTAKALGISLNSLIDGFLHNFIKTKKITYGEEIPNAKTQASLKKSEEEIKAGKVSPKFSNAKEAIRWLNDTNAIYENGTKVRDRI